ncbi:MAG: peptide-methionine (S)-S-oxide reductase MsrA [Bacteriovorax sp.]
MGIQKALLGAGCFWGVEHILKKIEGIVSTDVGYSGGDVADPTYPMVCTGSTGHAEVVLVEFDSNVISYEKVLDVFFRLHDPTTVNRQHNDIGTQYRSVIFYYDDEQKRIAEEVIKKVNDSKVFKDPVVTQVVKAGPFYRAEDYHQDYLIKNPDGYMCHILRNE